MESRYKNYDAKVEELNAIKQDALQYLKNGEGYLGYEREIIARFETALKDEKKFKE